MLEIACVKVRCFISAVVAAKCSSVDWAKVPDSVLSHSGVNQA